ncbi:hypothetical protein [Actinoplanes sp. NPDC049599]|uniref:hypothetical protein n=1 Tax=Actinoplanes sp. NPDC049599 TaxID=3363903 RepID=UPI00378BD1DD
MTNPCTCGTAAEARKILDGLRRGTSLVDGLAEKVVHDGITCAGTPEWLGSFVALLPSLDPADRVAALRLLWELTVDPAVPASLGRKGLLVDPPLPDGPCGSPSDNARACRRIVGPSLTAITPAPDADTVELDAWAALLSAVPEGFEMLPGLGVRGVLPLAVLAGSYERPELIAWFAARLAEETTRVAAAIGLRNAGFPDQPPSAAVAVLAAEAVAPTLDLWPWIRHSEAVDTYGRLLLDWPSAHREVVGAALAAEDEEVRYQGIGEAGRGLRCWRASGLVPLLVAAVDDPEPDVAEQAIVELSRGRLAGDVLLAVVGDPGMCRRAQASALRALARDGDERCLEPLLGELRTPALIADMTVAVQGMRHFADRIVPAVGEYLRGAAARSLWPRTRSVVRAVSGWPESIELVGEFTAFLEGEARVEALYALGDLGVPVTGLGAVQEPEARAAAAWALWRCAGELDAALTLLGDLLGGESPGRRAAALCAIRFGPAAEALRDPLRRLTEIGRDAATYAGTERLDEAVAACGALAAMGRPGEAPPAVLAAALRKRRDVDLVLTALERGAGRGDGVEALLTTLATDERRFTWPADAGDNDVADDERWQATARRLSTLPL